jgi:serine palmitoyltransferase
MLYETHAKKTARRQDWHRLESEGDGPSDTNIGYDESDSDLPKFAVMNTYVGFALLFMGGIIGDFLHRLFNRFFPSPTSGLMTTPEGYASIVDLFVELYVNHAVRSVCDIFGRLVISRPGRVINIQERVSDNDNRTFRFTEKVLPCINLASYNYLGFSEDLPAVTEDNLEALHLYGVGSCASPTEGGKTNMLDLLEAETARFVGKKAAVVFSMGFGTNLAGLPALFTKGTLVFSDSLNHASLVAGGKLSQASKQVFPHGDIAKLERLIRLAILEKQPKTHKPWDRIVLLVEGIYSMEGDIGLLPQFVALKKKYKLLLYVDEAHSIGAIGKTGRGVCEHFGVDPAEVDILMGTYTKSFGSIGGYIASDDENLITYLRRGSGLTRMGCSLHSAACQQALSSLRLMDGPIGHEKIRRIAENAAFFRAGLVKMGVAILGDDASPVIPMLIVNSSKVREFTRACLDQQIAVVGVGFPATPFIGSRARFCVSASHTKKDLQYCLDVIDQLATRNMLKYERSFPFS